jgi:integrase
VATLQATWQRKRAPEALIRTSHPGVYRRGRRYVAVYLQDGRQRKETVSSFAEARAIKVARQAEARAERLGPTLRDHALRWVGGHAGLGHDTVGERTRREYRRLLTTFAFRYFPPDTRLGQVDREALQGFITWLATYRGERGRLGDRSIANVLVPLRLCLADAEREGHIHGGPAKTLLLPRRRGGQRLALRTGPLPHPRTAAPCARRDPREVVALLRSPRLDRPPGLEAIALRWMDLELDGDPYLWVRRSVVGGVIGAPESRFGRRCIPLDAGLVARLAGRRCTDAGDEDLVFPSTSGTPLNPDNVRYRVLVPAVERAGLSGIGFHAFRHTCASMLIERGLSPLRLQRWMGHHSAAYTLDTYGHLIDAEMAPALDLGAELSCH